MRRARNFVWRLVAVLGVAATQACSAESFLFDQNALLYSTVYDRGVNYASQRGVPLSDTPGTPVGSDGRAPGDSTPTVGQFQGFVAYGAIVRPVSPNRVAGTALTGPYAANAVVLGLARNSTLVQPWAEIGAPYFSRPSSLLFGSVIPPPPVDASGTLLVGDPGDYWRAEPNTTDNHATGGYYWSPHAGVVFATKAGPIDVVWRAKAPTVPPPSPADQADPTKYVSDGGNFYALKAVQYIASGGAVKDPRRIYWTEKTFAQTGKAVDVPTARINAINIVYRDLFPDHVATEYIAPGQSLIIVDPGQRLNETRTLWYENGQIHAYNLEGRCFVELLGPPTGADLRVHLGFEIVDVIKEALPQDVAIELGEKITAYPDGRPDGDLVPRPLPAEIGANFLYRKALTGSGEADYYAVAETSNPNDVLVRWLEPGLEGLRWPLVLARYDLVWPVDAAKYSHYIRPEVATDAEAALTAVPLPSANAPGIQYQDPLDVIRGKLTAKFEYYTFLTRDHPVHRGLLRFQSGEHLAFERVLSWLDVNLKSPAAQPADPVAGTLTQWEVASPFSPADFKDFPAFAGRLLTGTDPLTVYLRSRLTSATLAALTAYQTSGGVGGAALQAMLVTEINVILNGVALIPPAVFPPSADPYQFNRAVLAAGYPDELYAGPEIGSAGTLILPRVVHQTVEVGHRIAAPAGEQGATGDYLAGYILQANGNSFHPGAYVDPFVNGFGAANGGAIIPVNAIPGANHLDIWWFRRNQTTAVQNEANGFQPIYWPAVIGQYTLQWPANPDEIVLAGNNGSGALPSLQAKGTIYTQNDAALPGYNPNEEHALMLGGQAYALRDDLNITTGDGYSSEPFVLLDYVESDHRPAMRPLHVLREKPGDGIVFDYIIQAGGNRDHSGAGSPLQAPMPLPFLPAPVEIVPSVDETGATIYTTVNYDTEPSQNSGDLPAGWGTLGDAQDNFPNYARFTYRDRKNNFWVLRGLHSGGVPVLMAGTYNPVTKTWSAPPAATAVTHQPFSETFHASRRSETLVLQPASGTVLPGGLRIDGLTLSGTPGAATGGPRTLNFLVTDTGDNSTVTVTLSLTVVDVGSVVAQGPLHITTTPATGPNITYVGRPPYLAEAAVPQNSFTMRFYYKTQAGFAWPGVATAPAVGSIVPYLRPLNSAADPASRQTASLDIVYRPVWPSDPPTLSFGETLMDPKHGLPAVRGQTSVQLLYQQAIALSITDPHPAVVLHDPIRQKTYDLNPDDDHPLVRLPDGVRTDLYQGKTYFPNLPPHLAQRFYFDPDLSPLGSLVFKGEYHPAALGENYVSLNVLRGADLAATKALCPAFPADQKTAWDAAVDRLATSVETFFENPAVPGEFITDNNHAVSIGIGDLAEVTDSNTAVASYALSASGPGQGFVTFVVGDGGNPAQTPAGDPVTLYVLKVTGGLYRGELKIIPSANPLSELSTFEHTGDLAGRFAEYEYEWKIAPPVDGAPPAADADMSNFQPLVGGLGVPRYTLGGSGVQTLVDNYIVMRYRPANATHPLYHPENRQLAWSQWTEPQLAEGWIKRVLAGINPFGQRVTDLFNNGVNTDANILTSAGRRWEGDIALNLANIDHFGLIEIYETVLKRGRSLSIDAQPGINVGPANDALLLAAGYLNDLYMLVGNEAYADASNPTIGIGTKDSTYGDIATALFAFKGQEPSLLEEELALLRGRDEFLQPGVQTAPVYNRLVWNYTRGIDAGEVIYSLNYNILDQNNDGRVDAADAALLYPQGHGDAYGHYLTALKGYYSLLMNQNFDWVPRIEAVTVLGKPVAVDYFDERKFAAAAAAVARTGRQIFDLTWRRDYLPGQDTGWAGFSETRTSSRTVMDGANIVPIVRHWGVDPWASRTMQGAYLNWIVGNAILPDVDPDPTHEGIQKIDRTTVPELAELPATAAELQTALDNAEGRLTPLGLPEGGLAFDIDPNLVVGANPQTHFEQIYSRAKGALNNAVVSFDDAKDVTRLMRSEQDSLADLQAGVAKQELAFENSLIELYGTPYPDDIGPGRTYVQDYSGPDLVHYVYVENPELTFNDQLNPQGTQTFRIDTQNVPVDWLSANEGSFNAVVRADDPNYEAGKHYFEFQFNDHGFYAKPRQWTGTRHSPGRIQQAISEYITAHQLLGQALADAEGAKAALDDSLTMFNLQNQLQSEVGKLEAVKFGLEQTLSAASFANDVFQQVTDSYKTIAEQQADIIAEALPKSLLVGLASGGDLTSGGRSAILAAGAVAKDTFEVAEFVQAFGLAALQYLTETASAAIDFHDIPNLEGAQQLRETVYGLNSQLGDLSGAFQTINGRLRELDDKHRALQSLLAQGERLQNEREISRQRSAALVQGFRTRDAAFRLFRNEKLDRYKSLFDLASRYAYLAANAYDYETGLLGTEVGKSFVNRFVSARALGVVKNGEPQYAGSDTGDPGLSSALAEMKADWDVLKGRLGFNNPDGYGTTVSLRRENLRILPGSEGDQAWQDVLQQGRRDNLLDDADVRRYCMQIDPGTGDPVPGIVLTFATGINPGENLFGKALAAGDSAFSASSFATKISAVGIALEGYRGMNDPLVNGGTGNGAGGNPTADPPNWFLDPLALAATPYVYLIPVGVDAMRSPPLGDASELRTWNVSDVTIPMPFNVGASDFSSKQLYQSADSLSEPLFGLRKHQAFRPVSSTAAFGTDIYGAGGSLQPSQFTNRRLIGRSVWNTQWKLVIPGNTLLNDPNEGLARFIQTVTDVKLHFVTYSYSGN